MKKVSISENLDVEQMDPWRAPRWVRINPWIYGLLKEEASRRGIPVSTLVRRYLERLDGLRALPGLKPCSTCTWPRLVMRVDGETWDRFRHAARTYGLTLTDALNCLLAHKLGVVEEYVLHRQMAGLAGPWLLR
jgi:hypothetical protein